MMEKTDRLQLSSITGSATLSILRHVRHGTGARMNMTFTPRTEEITRILDLTEHSQTAWAAADDACRWTLSPLHF